MVSTPGVGRSGSPDSSLSPLADERDARRRLSRRYRIRRTRRPDTDRRDTVADRVVVLRDRDGLSFVADGCAALADAANEIRLARAGDADLVRAYAELVVAYSRLMRDGLAERGETVRLAIIDHLVERLRQAQAGEVAMSVLDLVDRLHGELSSERVPV